MADVLLHVCTTCQAGQALRAGEAPLGRRLHDAVAAVLAGEAGPGPAVELRETTCLANCERGCSAVLAAPGKWTYLLGGLSPAVAAELAAYARTYGESRNGTVMPSRRAAALRDAVMGRGPPPEGAPAAGNAAAGAAATGSGAATERAA